VDLGSGKTLSGEVGTLEGHVGIHNPDGSTGFNVGIGATLAGATLNQNYGHTSETGGIANSHRSAVAAHIGVRDADHNGKPEVCVGVSYGPMTVGGCAEIPIKM
jgi:hypothetical protein